MKRGKEERRKGNMEEKKKVGKEERMKREKGIADGGKHGRTEERKNGRTEELTNGSTEERFARRARSISSLRQLFGRSQRFEVSEDVSSGSKGAHAFDVCRKFGKVRKAAERPMRLNSVERVDVLEGRNADKVDRATFEKRKR